MTIRYETGNGVARLTIDRAAVRNALSLETARELTACLARVNDDPDVRAVVLTGAGDRVFASGAPISTSCRRSWVRRRPRAATTRSPAPSV